MPRSIDLKIPPQVSLYQDPLLFYIYTRFAQEELFINHPMYFYVLNLDTLTGKKE